MLGGSMTPLRMLRGGFLVLGLLALGSWSRNDLAARAFQSAASRNLESGQHPRSRTPWSLGPGAVFAAAAPIPGTRAPSRIEDPAVLGRIEIPRLGIRAIVAEGSDLGTLGRAVGHIPSTACPGSAGNCTLAGHRDTFFRGLGGIRVADVIRIVAPPHLYEYRVEWTAVVDPKRVDVLAPTARPSLTLVTCYPFGFLGHAPQRFVVRARQLERLNAAGDPTQGLTAQGR